MTLGDNAVSILLFILCFLAFIPLSPPKKKEIQEETPYRISIQVRTTVPLALLRLKFLRDLIMTAVSYYVHS